MDVESTKKILEKSKKISQEIAEVKKKLVEAESSAPVAKDAEDDDESSESEEELEPVKTNKKRKSKEETGTYTIKCEWNVPMMLGSIKKHKKNEKKDTKETVKSEEDASKPSRKRPAVSSEERRLQRERQKLIKQIQPHLEILKGGNGFLGTQPAFLLIPLITFDD